MFGKKDSTFHTASRNTLTPSALGMFGHFRLCDKNVIFCNLNVVLCDSAAASKDLLCKVSCILQKFLYNFQAKTCIFVFRRLALFGLLAVNWGRLEENGFLAVKSSVVLPL